MLGLLSTSSCSPVVDQEVGSGGGFDGRRALPAQVVGVGVGLLKGPML